MDLDSYSQPPNSQLPIPRVSDGVVFRVLNNLLILDGERLSYRTLDVEQIGSVYEAIMGFNLEVARGPSIAIKPKKAHGAPASIDLEKLLATKPADRPKSLKEETDQALTGQALDSLKKATTIDDLLAALEKRIAREVTPNVVSRGAMLLQPSDERRRSGSHYTPRSLTEPIVRTTLRPILERLGVGSSDFGGGDLDRPSLPHISQIQFPRKSSGVGSSDFGGGDRKGDVGGRENKLISRPESLPTGDGPGGGLLPGHEGDSAGGDLRAHRSDPKGGRGDSREHRGGSRAREPQGVPAIPPHSASQPSGTRDPRDAERTRRTDEEPSVRPTAAAHGPTGPDAQHAAATSANPTPQILTPNSYPTPEQILDLKVGDPAMGSGAFLVEACRQLGDALVKAWHLHDCIPKLPPDEDEVLHARRLVAQRCLYGLDKNPMAVDLSKLSLWLATLAKDHPFTFLDHSLRCGDSLVGLSREQIAAFHWQPKKQMELLEGQIGKRIARAT